MMVWNALRPWAAAAVLAGCCMTSAASAAVIYDSGGFEAPRFLTTFVSPLEPTPVGNLRGQDAAVRPWGYSGATGATAQVTAPPAGSPAAEGAQSVRVDRTSADRAWSPDLTFTPSLANGTAIARVSWDQYTVPTTTNASNFGPFFGIDAYGGTTFGRIGAMGVDATTGEILLIKPVTGIDITPADTTVSFNAWHHFELNFDYQSQTYAGLVDNALVFSGVGFVNTGKSTFINAGISALQAAPTANANQTGTAYFDNYNVSGVPEPTTIAVSGVVGLLALSRRPRRSR